MKKLILTFFLVTGLITFAQYPKGKVIADSLYSRALENSGGENPTRSLHIYLPPNYEESNNRYPVIYHLHGFGGTDKGQIEDNAYHKLLDKAITTGKIKPVIVVFPNQHTLYRGSFHANSAIIGNWVDFTAKDLVNYIDANYRTIKSNKSRGITGHSMGGYGAIKTAMMNPDVFSATYSLSGALGLYKDIGAKGRVYKRLEKIDSREKLVKGYKYFLENALVAMGRAFSPNPDKPPFYADLPYSYKSDSLIVDFQTIELWNEQFLHNMADDYVENLKQLKAIKIDWGRNDEFDWIVMSCKALSQKLESLGIKHYAEEYLGRHGNKLWTEDGRILNEVLPFFNMHLKFE